MKTDRLQENKLFPVFLKLDKINLLIVGGGKIGLEKLKAVLENSPEANVCLVAPQISEEIEKLVLNYPVRLIRRPFQPSDLDGHQLAIVAIDNREISTFIQQEAAKRKVLVNVADKPAQCDFYLSSIVKKGHLKIAISTNGKSPTMAKRLKEVFDEHLPTELEESLEQLNRLRGHLKGDFRSKVKQLNKTTAILTKQKQFSTWKKIQEYLFLLAITPVLMLAGYLVMGTPGLVVVACIVPPLVLGLWRYLVLKSLTINTATGVLSLVFHIILRSFL